MADLEQQIAAWRSRLSALVGGNSDFVAELEVHLRDAVEDQAKAVPASYRDSWRKMDDVKIK